MDGKPFQSEIPVNDVLDRLAKAGRKEFEFGQFAHPRWFRSELHYVA
ncbi:hypothetical protein [Paraburkholderia bannensis]|nr:hypothetical protein [Paraburkholderia bannensis]